ncbi:MAG: DUF2147 domain-containing protein [Verrucomicrobia bacterium]|nr:DUF2147 domain-containing protein [Verrucomicrobiota bacterium]
MKIFSLFFLLASCCTAFAQDITGFWKSINEKTGKPQCMVAIYEHDNTYYGRIVSTYDNEGKLEETLDEPDARAPGIIGNPYYCGMDLIWGLDKRGSKFKGRIVDPKKGNIYRAELWVEDGNLIVRGKLLCFGRNQTWVPASQEDFSESFKKPDVSKFIPVIPEVD